MANNSPKRRRIQLTFWTLMLWLVLLKISAARIAFANRRAYSQHC